MAIYASGRPVAMEYFDSTGAGFAIDSGIRVHGSSYMRPKLRTDSKFGFRLYFRSAYDESPLDYPLIPKSEITSFDRLVLRSGHNDPTNPFMSDEMLRRLYAGMGYPTSQGMFAHLFLNGDYQGYYNPAERIDTGSLQRWFGGANEWDVVKPFGVLSEGDLNAWKAMVEFFSSQDLTLPANFLEAARHLDLVAFADYILVNLYADTGDWVGSNWRAVREKVPGSRFLFMAWDAEFSFGIYGRSPATNSLLDSNELAGDEVLAGIFRQLRRNEDFRVLFADRVERHFFHQGRLTDEVIADVYEQTRNEVEPVIADFSHHIGDVWIPRRRAFLLEDLREAGLMASIATPEVGVPGGTVPAGTGIPLVAQTDGEIYYTTDGSDPRSLLLGSTAPTARLYDGEPVTVMASTLLRARSFSEGLWSALREVRYRVGTVDSGIVFTELQYHPAEGLNPEFLEFIHRGAASVDLSGARFEGIDFEFPKGSRIESGEIRVLVRESDQMHFDQRFPGVAVRGYYGGKLSNSGEQLKIIAPDGAVLAVINYSDRGGWPEVADGGGPSLELRRIDADLNDAAQWRASFGSGGSPGSYVPDPTPIVRISEVLSRGTTGGGGPFVEVEPVGLGLVDLSGWTLESLRKELVLFTFSEGSLLVDGDREVVLLEWEEDGQVGLRTPLGLSPNEDTVVLRDGEGRVVDSLRYGDHVAGLSLARDGALRWGLGSPTPGERNILVAEASPDQLRINEWMADPVSGEDDWFELYNSDPLRPLALAGLTFSDGRSFATLRAPVFIEGGGFVRLWADNGSGPDHLPFRLSGAGGLIQSFDSNHRLLDQVAYGRQQEGVSEGLVPDGAQVIESFPGAASPGATNQDEVLGPIVFSEILWLNEGLVEAPQGVAASYIEVVNESNEPVTTAGLRLALAGDDELAWPFPRSGMLFPGQRAIVWIGVDLPLATDEAWFFSLPALPSREGALLTLLGADGRTWDQLEFGRQLTNVALGRDDDGWGLRQAPTPGTEEAGRLMLGNIAELRINEWLAASTVGGDWVELFHSGSLPVALSGLKLTDEPGLAGKAKTTVGPLTFLAAKDWFVLGDADWLGEGSFTPLEFSLAREGEYLRLYDRQGQLVDGVDFGRQARDWSQGRVPDGSDGIATLLWPSPGTSNHGQRAEDLDEDGIADEWERQQGLDPTDPSDAARDLDGDGISNLEEFLVGTPPGPLEPVLIEVHVAWELDDLVLTANIPLAGAYRIEFREDLMAGDWQLLAEGETTGSETLIQVSEQPLGTSRFYRVVQP